MNPSQLLHKMKVKEIFGDRLKTLKYAGMCCSENTKNPTELAILKECEAEKIDYTANRKEEEPFSSASRRRCILLAELNAASVPEKQAENASIKMIITVYIAIILSPPQQRNYS